MFGDQDRLEETRITVAGRGNVFTVDVGDGHLVEVPEQWVERGVEEWPLDLYGLGGTQRWVRVRRRRWDRLSRIDQQAELEQARWEW